MRVIGLGFQADATPAAIDAALRAAGPAEAVAVVETRREHPSLVTTNLPILPIPRADLAGVETPTRSPRVMERFGCGSVAEAVAMIASGGGVIQPRRVIGGVTIAVAEGPGRAII